MGMLYKSAAKIFILSETTKTSVKNLILSGKHKNKKQLYALVFETLKYRQILKNICEKVKLQKREIILKSDHLTHVMVYDLLFGKGLEPDSKYEKAVLRHKAALKAELARLKISTGVTKNKELLTDFSESTDLIPRYVRVNTIKTTVVKVTDQFLADDYKEQYLAKLAYKGFIDEVKKLKGKTFAKDPHISELLIFPPGTDFHDHPLYKSGEIILQDKASCLPVHILHPVPGDHVMDFCAAPGNKTSHAAALMKNSGKIFAFDRDNKRFSTLSTMLLKAGVTCTECTCQDVLSIDTSDSKYRDVTHVIVDPSCSGSGISSRSKENSDDNFTSDKDRLNSLAAFQEKVLCHALSLPNAQRIVYSTCSTHTEENEAVVRAALKKWGHMFQLAPALPEVPSRGTPDHLPNAEHCLRLTADTDLTNGFFVAYLVRRDKAISDVTAAKMEDEMDVDYDESETRSLKKKPKRKRKNESSNNSKDDFKQAEVTTKKQKDALPSRSNLAKMYKGRGNKQKKKWKKKPQPVTA